MKRWRKPVDILLVEYDSFSARRLVRTIEQVISEKRRPRIRLQRMAGQISGGMLPAGRPALVFIDTRCIGKVEDFELFFNRCGCDFVPCISTRNREGEISLFKWKLIPAGRISGHLLTDNYNEPLFNILVRDLLSQLK